MCSRDVDDMPGAERSQMTVEVKERRLLESLESLLSHRLNYLSPAWWNYSSPVCVLEMMEMNHEDEA